MIDNELFADLLGKCNDLRGEVLDLRRQLADAESRVRQSEELRPTLVAPTVSVIAVPFEEYSVMRKSEAACAAMRKALIASWEYKTGCDGGVIDDESAEARGERFAEINRLVRDALASDAGKAFLKGPVR